MTITEPEAKQLGLAPFTSFFAPFEGDLLKRMFADIAKRNPEARMVTGERGRVRVWCAKVPKPVNRPDNPKAMRGSYPAPCKTVGRA